MQSCPNSAQRWNQSDPDSPARFWTRFRRSGLFEGIDGISISDDGSTILVASGGAYRAIDLNADKPEPKDVSLDGL